MPLLRQPPIYTMRTLASFPMMSKNEFEVGCEDIADILESSDILNRSEMSIALKACYDSKHLKITKPFNVLDNLGQSWATEVEDLMEEEDEEALSHPILQQAYIVWDVVYSSSYHVPVLYFSIKDTQYRFPATMETLHRIIPERYKTQTESHGPMGGITITDHPFTNTPVFFLHPCQTADVLATSVEKKNEITPAQYLLLFMTSLGKYVQLEFPLSFVERLHQYALDK